MGSGGRMEPGWDWRMDRIVMGLGEWMEPEWDWGNE